ncbi:MAG: L-threonylcarbamoyladenylate synthase [Brevinematia bacterium]
MITRILKISPNEVEKDIFLLKEAAIALSRGEVVAFPTETVYGLGADATNHLAVKKIFELKGRPSDNPLIVHLHSKNQIQNYAYISNELEREIIEKLTPGPVTIILKKKDIISEIATAGLETVGIRIPYNPIAQKLIELSGIPICAPSANISGKPSATEASTVIEEFSGKIPFIIDGGRTHIGIESTVLMVKEEKEKFTIHILRPGFITKEDIEDFIKNINSSKTIEVEYSDKVLDTPLSPGQKYKHYSPKSNVIVVKNPKNAIDILKEIKNEKIGLLGRTSFIKEMKRITEYLKIKEIIEIEWCEYDLIDCARNLFFAYRIFDKHNVYAIIVENLEEKGIGYAIMNRVKRSATYIL